MFDRIREAHEMEGSAYTNGAEAMAETLEIIRKNEVQRRCCAVLVQQRTWRVATCSFTRKLCHTTA